MLLEISGGVIVVVNGSTCEHIRPHLAAGYNAGKIVS